MLNSNTWLLVIQHDFWMPPCWRTIWTGYVLYARCCNLSNKAQVCWSKANYSFWLLVSRFEDFVSFDPCSASTLDPAPLLSPMLVKGRAQRIRWLKLVGFRIQIRVWICERSCKTPFLVKLACVQPAKMPRHHKARALVRFWPRPIYNAIILPRDRWASRPGQSGHLNRPFT